MKRVKVYYCGTYYSAVYTVANDVVSLVSLSDGHLLTTDLSCFDKTLVAYIEATILANEVIR